MPISKQILHIEDNIDNRILVRRLLQAYKFEVIEAENANEALNLLESNQPDLILMDMNMPDVDGYTLTKQLRQMSKFDNTPIIAITANVMRGDREKSLNVGCDGYIDKPIDVDKFIDQINQYMN